jgi:hypothetical protein
VMLGLGVGDDIDASGHALGLCKNENRLQERNRLRAQAL